MPFLLTGSVSLASLISGNDKLHPIRSFSFHENQTHLNLYDFPSLSNSLNESNYKLISCTNSDWEVFVEVPDNLKSYPLLDEACKSTNKQNFIDYKYDGGSNAFDSPPLLDYPSLWISSSYNSIYMTSCRKICHANQTSWGLTTTLQNPFHTSTTFKKAKKKKNGIGKISAIDHILKEMKGHFALGSAMGDGNPLLRVQLLPIGDLFSTSSLERNYLKRILFFDPAVFNLGSMSTKWQSNLSIHANTDDADICGLIEKSYYSDHDDTSNDNNNNGNAGNAFAVVSGVGSAASFEFKHSGVGTGSSSSVHPLKLLMDICSSSSSNEDEKKRLEMAVLELWPQTHLGSRGASSTSGFASSPCDVRRFYRSASLAGREGGGVKSVWCIEHALLDIYSKLHYDLTDNIDNTEKGGSQKVAPLMFLSSVGLTNLLYTNQGNDDDDDESIYSRRSLGVAIEVEELMRVVRAFSNAWLPDQIPSYSVEDNIDKTVVLAIRPLLSKRYASSSSASASASTLRLKERSKKATSSTVIESIPVRPLPADPDRPFKHKLLNSNANSHVLLVLPESEARRGRRLLQTWRHGCDLDTCQLYIRMVLLTVPDEVTEFTSHSDAHFRSSLLIVEEWIKSHVAALDLVVMVTSLNAALALYPPGRNIDLNGTTVGMVPPGPYGGSAAYRLDAPIVFPHVDFSQLDDNARSYNKKGKVNGNENAHYYESITLRLDSMAGIGREILILIESARNRANYTRNGGSVREVLAAAVDANKDATMVVTDERGLIFSPRKVILAESKEKMYEIKSKVLECIVHDRHSGLCGEPADTDYLPTNNSATFKTTSDVEESIEENDRKQDIKRDILFSRVPVCGGSASREVHSSCIAKLRRLRKKRDKAKTAYYDASEKFFDDLRERQGTTRATSADAGLENNVVSSEVTWRQTQQSLDDSIHVPAVQNWTNLFTYYTNNGDWNNASVVASYLVSSLWDTQYAWVAIHNMAEIGRHAYGMCPYLPNTQYDAAVHSLVSFKEQWDSSHIPGRMNLQRSKSNDDENDGVGDNVESDVLGELDIDTYLGRMDVAALHMAVSGILTVSGLWSDSVDWYASSLVPAPYSSVLDIQKKWHRERIMYQRDVSKGKYKNQFRVHYICYASHEWEGSGLTHLRRSARLSGVTLTVVGLDKPWTDYRDKLLGYHAHLKSAAVKNHDIVVLLDGFDVLLLPAVRKLPKMLSKAEVPVLFCAEDGIYPEFTASWFYHRGDERYDDAAREVSMQRFLNSGCIAGRAEQLREVLDFVTAEVDFLRDDQQAFVRYMLQNPHMAGLQGYTSVNRADAYDYGDGFHSSITPSSSSTSLSYSETHLDGSSGSGSGVGVRSSSSTASMALMITCYRLQVGSDLLLSSRMRLEMATDDNDSGSSDDISSADQHFSSIVQKNGVGIVHCNNMNSSSFYYNVAFGLQRLEDNYLRGPDGALLLQAVWALEEGRLDDAKDILNDQVILANATSRGGTNDYRDMLLLHKERLSLNQSIVNKA